MMTLLAVFDLVRGDDSGGPLENVQHGERIATCALRTCLLRAYQYNSGS